MSEGTGDQQRRIESTKTNHFARRSRIYLKAIQAAYKELRRMQVHPTFELRLCV